MNKLDEIQATFERSLVRLCAVARRDAFEECAVIADRIAAEYIGGSRAAAGKVAARIRRISKETASSAFGCDEAPAVRSEAKSAPSLRTMCRGPE